MIYKEDCAGMNCQCGECSGGGEVYMHSKCHPEAPTWVKLENDILTLLCSVCEKMVAEFAVRSGKEN